MQNNKLLESLTRIAESLDEIISLELYNGSAKIQMYKDEFFKSFKVFETVQIDDCDGKNVIEHFVIVDGVKIFTFIMG